VNSNTGLRFLNAVQQSCGTGADVAVLDRNPEALRRVDAVLGNRVRTLFSTRDVVELLCPRADRHRDRSRAGLNRAEFDHGANREGGENRRDGELQDD
jgi:hypothetical protein